MGVGLWECCICGAYTVSSITGVRGQQRRTHSLKPHGRSIQPSHSPRAKQPWLHQKMYCCCRMRLVGSAFEG